VRRDDPAVGGAKEASLTCYAGWAEVSFGAKRKGLPIQTADAWIAASALYHQVPLITYQQSRRLLSARSGRKEFGQNDSIGFQGSGGTQSFPRTRWRPENARAILSCAGRRATWPRIPP